MAARQSGNIGLILTTIFFAFAAIIAIVVAVMLGNKIEENRKAAESAKQELNKFIASSERTQDRVGQLEAEGKQAQPARTVYGQLVTQVDRLKRTVAGSEALTIAEIDNKMKSAGIPEGKDALSHVEALNGQVTALTEQIAALDEQVQAEQEKVKALSDRFEAQRSTENRDAQKIAEALSAVEQEAVSIRDKNAELQRELQEKIDTSGDAARTAFEQLTEQKHQLDTLVTNLRNELNRAKAALKKESPGVPDPSDEIDGQIIALPASDPNTVYINLGRRDHLVLGMTFEVYDAARGVEFEEVEGKEGQTQFKRGKATIEVVSMSDTSAMCRVVRSSFGRPILVQDPIANLVYDKDRKFKFYVVGDFDLDGDGKATLSDREQVIDLIGKWGGVVVKPEERLRRLGAAIGLEAADANVLPLDTDFVLLGKEPTLPPADAAVVDPAEKARIDNLRTVFEQYSRIRSEAKTLGIPVLNQNRFLALIGYYQQ